MSQENPLSDGDRTQSDPARGHYDSAAIARAKDLLDAMPQRIDRYRILERIGGGGMGEVYVAEQTEPIKRRVAIKVIKAGMDTRQVVARFEAERQALAMMDHPNIAKVFDAGATDAGRPYFVMELVRGVPITRFCDDNKFTTRQRVELLVPVCQAVQHAHQKGIIHRDIKPHNVLVTLHDGKPVPKVIDFGIAKATSQPLTDKTVYTEFRAMIGTPAYMSPEQAEMSGLDIDTRSDIYSLGVLAYELFTGTTPFESSRLIKAGLMEIQRIIKEEEPPRPSQRISTLGETLTSIASHRSIEANKLGKSVAGELDWIVMRALEKDRKRRYDTASDLSADLTRHLTGEPVIAAPPSWAYRAKKFTRKHKTPVLAGVALATLLSVGVIGTTWQWRRAERNAVVATKQTSLAIQQTAKAEEQRDSAETEVYIGNLALGQAALQADRWPEARQRLDACPESKRGWEWKFLRKLASTVELRIRDDALDAEVSPDGRWLATTSQDRAGLCLNRIDSAKSKGTNINAPADNYEVWFRFSTDGKDFVAAFTSNSKAMSPIVTIEHWSLGEKPELIKSTRIETDYSNSDLNLDGTRLVAFVEGHVSIFDTGNGTQIGSGFNPGFRGDQRSLVMFSDNLIACNNRDEEFVQFWDGVAKTVVSPRIPCSAFAVSADHALVCTVSTVSTPDVRNFATCVMRVVRIQNGDLIWASEPAKLSTRYEVPAFSNNGLLVCGSAFGIRDVNDGRIVGLKPLDSENSICFSPDSKLADCDDGFIREAQTFRPIASAFSWNHSAWPNIKFVPTRNQIVEMFANPALSDIDGRAMFVNLANINDADSPSYFVDEIQLEESLAFEGTLDPHPSGPAKFDLGTPQTTRPQVATITVSLNSPDGTRVVTTGDDKVVRFWDPNTWRELVAIPTESAVRQLRFTPDGTRLLINLADGTMEIWDTRGYAARQADRDLRFNEIPAAREYVKRLLSTPIASQPPQSGGLTETLKDFIRHDSSITTLRKLVAIEQLDLELRRRAAATQPAATRP